MVWAWYPYFVGVMTGIVLAGVGGMVFLAWLCREEFGDDEKDVKK